MEKEMKQTDISHLPEIVRLAEEVQQTQMPQLLKRGDQELAVVSPVEPVPKPKARRLSRPQLSNDWILNIIGLGSSEGPTDVSENKHKYLAEAYYSEFNPPSKK